MILVTGGTGFLGGHLVRRLLQTEDRVRLLCRSRPVDGPVDTRRVEIALGDVTDPATLGPAVSGAEYVYHVAGRVDFNPKDPAQLALVNEQGTRNVMEASLRAKVRRVVHVSSVSTIGATRDPECPLNEEDFGRGLGVDIAYPQSKLRGERVALEFAERGLDVVIANPTFFLGPGDRHFSSARTVLSFINGQVWVGLTTGGLGFTDVRDVAEGLVLAMRLGEPGQRYILGGHNLLLHEYHELLAQATGVRAPRLRLPAVLAQALAVVGVCGYRMLRIPTYVGVGDIRLARHYWLFDYTRARTKLGLVCRPPLETIRDTVAWLRQSGRCW